MTTIKKQSGAVLIIGLVLVMVLTILVLASVRSTVLQQKMATNLRDRDLTFQAAETALKAGEEYLRTTDPLPVFNNNNGIYTFNNARTFSQDADWVNLNTATPSLSLHQVPITPEYIIEKILLTDTVGESLDASKAVTSNYYRVTAKSKTGTSTVIVQSTYRR